MPTPEKYIKPTERKISGWMIALGVVGFLALATSFVFLGVRCWWPMLAAHLNPPHKIEQTVQSQSIPRPVERAAELPKDSAQSQGETSDSTEIQITEEGGDPSSATNPDAGASDGVKQDGNDLTITIEPPQDQQKDASASNNAGNPASEAPKPKTHPRSEKPKKDAKVAPSQPVTAERTSSSPTGTRGYKVQAGTFANRSNADSLVTDLKANGYKPEIKAVQSEAGTLYRVELGQYKTKEGAQDLADDLSAQGYKPAVVAGSKSQ